MAAILTLAMSNDNKDQPAISAHSLIARKMADSPGSPLSSLSSDDFAEDVKTEDRDQSIDGLPDAPIMPPAKRQRVGPFSHRNTPESHTEDLIDISSDTSGDVPGSPTSGLTQPQDEEALGHEQVTVCKWEGCPVGDTGDMDALVEHIHNDHIGARQKKYACEWEACSRKGMPHASGYALRAHMRSHTREKPFYCALPGMGVISALSLMFKLTSTSPECDRSFTRSDALAKHMRTVHETEALRPSDPVPKHHSASMQKPQRIKLICSTKPPDQQRQHVDGEGLDDELTAYDTTDMDTDGRPLPVFEYPDDVRFTSEELAQRPDQLFRLLRRQVHWAEQESRDLRGECEALELRRKEEWYAKELVLANLMEAELATALDCGTPFDTTVSLRNDLPNPMLPMEGTTPWYRMLTQDVKEELG